MAFDCFQTNVVLQVGEKVPDVAMYENECGVKISLTDICKGVRVILLGVPGAFTPVCTKTPLFGYLERSEDFKKKKGIKEIICVSVNDVFVMTAWHKAMNAQGKARFFADPQALFTKAIGLEFFSELLGGIRSRRYSMVVDNGIVTQLTVEPGDPEATLTCSMAERMRNK